MSRSLGSKQHRQRGPPRPATRISANSSGSGITVARWEFSPAIAGGPIYLRMTLDGTQAAIDQMRAGRAPMIEVRWVRSDVENGSGAPNLVTPLTIGRPDLAGIFEQQIRREGFFEWHSWAKKDHLSPGTWLVSVTYRDGQPLTCGREGQPCRFTINIG